MALLGTGLGSGQPLNTLLSFSLSLFFLITNHFSNSHPRASCAKADSHPVKDNVARPQLSPVIEMQSGTLPLTGQWILFSSPGLGV